MSYKTNESFDKKYNFLLNIPEISNKDSYVTKFTISTTLIMHENLKEFLNNNVAHSVFIRLIKGIDHHKVAYGVIVTVILMILAKFKDQNNNFYLPEDLMTIRDMQYLESYSYDCQGLIDTVEKLEQLMVIVSEIEQLDIFKRYSDICYKLVSECERYTFYNYTLLFEKGTIGEDFKEFSFNYPYRLHLIIAVKFKVMCAEKTGGFNLVN